jgi:hypothetical protein
MELSFIKKNEMWLKVVGELKAMLVLVAVNELTTKPNSLLH